MTIAKFVVMPARTPFARGLYGTKTCMRQLRAEERLNT